MQVSTTQQPCSRSWSNGSGQLPPNQHFIEITIPNGSIYEILNTAALPNWYAEVASASQTYGETWQQGRRSVILIVPSVVARIEKNILINPEHPEVRKIEKSLHQPVWWDTRLFTN
jgi:RES domain-containing protein